ncbi:MAG: HAMP domain-containing histidine kinase [Tannerella sp.]|jgi:two-component system phosphate regulon sensor histidine kinase PhoR|nr:HAMP domain-containing histidine kinase [Tannerella sp.]
MRKQYVILITVVGLVALLCIQGFWLYHTYYLLHRNLIATFEDGFARSIEKEVYLRNEIHKNQIMNGSVVAGARPDQDFYNNVLAFHEFLLTFDFPISLLTVDSIWSQRIHDEVPGTVKYRLIHTDAGGKVIEEINRGADENSTDTLRIERPIRNDNSEYLQMIIDSPFKLVMRRMTVLLVASILIVFLLIYIMYRQVDTIFKQERIAGIRDDFMHAMVHDMKNPISNLLLLTGQLQRGIYDDNPERKELTFSVTMQQINRLLAFTNKILTVSQFESGKIVLSKSEVKLKELIDSLIDDYKLNPAKPTAFTTEIADDITVYAAEDYIGDVFRNLIDNAIKYSKSSVAINIGAEKKKSGTIIRIRDNGIGIAEKDRKLLFMKFERIGVTDKNRKTGFGLGLYFVHQIITAHGGSISVNSVPDEYSEFTIFLPDKT